jgi:hypothetical protein
MPGSLAELKIQATNAWGIRLASSSHDQTVLTLVLRVTASTWGGGEKVEKDEEGLHIALARR